MNLPLKAPLGRFKRTVQRTSNATFDFLEHAGLRARIQYLDPGRPRRFPIKVQIEATSRCNLRCPSCSHGAEQGGTNLTAEELRTFLDRFEFCPAYIILSGTGEPLVHPGYMELVDVLAERSIECNFFTNGTLLNATAAGQILARPNITYIAISCDGDNKETFEALRRGASFEGWKENVGQFLNQVNRRQPPGVLVCTHTVVSRRNINEVEGIIRLSAALGFHRLHLIDLIPVDDNAAAMALSDEQVANTDWAAYQALGRKLGLLVFTNFRRRNRPDLRCLHPWEYIQVRPGGNVYPCYALYGPDRALVMGNLHRQSFQEIWHGEPFRSFRQSYVQGTNPLCRSCPFS